MVRPLQTYEDWKHCITALCGLVLTPQYVAKRLDELRWTDAFSTQKFVRSWGEDHRQRVIGWFERAEAELMDAFGDS